LEDYAKAIEQVFACEICGKLDSDWDEAVQGLRCVEHWNEEERENV
jgi:hypothetical protein